MYNTIMAIRDSENNIILEIGEIAKIETKAGNEHQGKITLLLSTGFFVEISKTFEKFVKYQDVLSIKKII
jgi:hypothetical protein